MSQQPLRVVEFYAGAGGFHFSLKRSSIPFDIVASIDINTNTNSVYSANFPHTPHLNRNICGLTAKELDSFRGDVFVLSPPCQPFTRQGQRRDNLDARTDSFFHLMQLLTQMKCLPSYLLMENVQGFEISQTRDHFISVLESLEYSHQEFLLSPAQFRVPNSRLRFYLLAKKRPLKFTLPDLDQPCRNADPLLPFVMPMDTHTVSSGQHSLEALTLTQRDPKAKDYPKSTSISPKDIAEKMDNSDTILSYLEVLTEEQLSQYLVPDKILLKYATALDIVQPSSSRSCCFTRAYGHYAVGTGSVVQASLGTRELDTGFQEYRRAVENTKEGVECDPVSFLRPLKLRYFTPREVANLMSFPASFLLPPSLTSVQCYKVLGNSLNITVVTALIRYLLAE